MHFSPQNVFKLEQEVYKKELIVWKNIQYSNNELCIQLIEGPLGIIRMMDEELVVSVFY
jgi:myosin-5